jgi:hypothetical protein
MNPRPTSFYELIHSEYSSSPAALNCSWDSNLLPNFNKTITSIQKKYLENVPKPSDPDAQHRFLSESGNQLPKRRRIESSNLGEDYAPDQTQQPNATNSRQQMLVPEDRPNLLMLADIATAHSSGNVDPVVLRAYALDNSPLSPVLPNIGMDVIVNQCLNSANDIFFFSFRGQFGAGYRTR